MRLTTHLRKIIFGLSTLFFFYNSYAQYQTTRYGTGTGNSNYGTFFGYYAGNKGVGSTGNSNSFFGRYSGYKATGWVNSFFGESSGYNVTSGGRNSFFGASSGYKTTTGSYNTFLGYSAGNGNTTGSYNIAVGREAGKNLNSGSYNIFFGRSAAITANVTGSYNISIGNNTGNELTSGQHNIFMGYAAGNDVTTGAYNIILGRQAGNYLKTGSRNVFIGYNAGYNETSSDKLYIDNSSSSSPLIWGDFSANSLKFNGSAQVTGSLNPSGGFINAAYFDDDGSLGGNSDDWMRLNGYVELSTSHDSHGIVLREKGNTNYMSITQKGGWSYLADNTSYSNYFLRGNGDDVEVRDNLKANSVTTRNYYTNGGIMNISGGGYGMDFQIDTDNNSSDVYRWFGNGAERMRLTDDGKLGIGMTPSSYRLHVAGDIYATGGWLRVDGQRGMYNQSYATHIYAHDANYWRTRSDRGIIIANKANAIKGYIYHDNANSFGLLDGDGQWGVRLEKDTDTRFYINNSEKMRIKTNGRVGVGTTDPASLFHVAGQITASSIAGLDLAGGGISGSNYNVTGVNELVINDPGEGINFSGGQKMYVVDDATDNKLYIGPGNVGLGITPAEKLHVNGAIRGHVAGGALQIKSAHGYVNVGAQNSSWSHFSTDRPKFYFNKGVVVDEGIVAAYDEDLKLISDYKDGNFLGMTISGINGNTTVHENLEIQGTLTVNKSTVTEDNTQDDLLVMKGDGTLASRSVSSIESPWLFTEILVGTDTMLAICPDSLVIGQISVDVIDLNGNLRFGDNAYIDDDLDYGDNGDNDDIPDDWMKFSDRIEFKSSATDYGIVLFDQTSYSDFLNLHHAAGTSYLSNGSGAPNFFMKSTGRNVEFGGTVNIPSLETSEYSSSESLTISADGDNNSTGEAIVFGTDGKAGEATFNEIMRLEEGGGVIISSLQENAAISGLMVRDATTGQVYSREANTVGPWDIKTSGDIHYSGGNIGLGIPDDATETIDIGDGTIRVRNLATTSVENDLLVVDAAGNFLKRNTSTLNLSPWTVGVSHLSYVDNVIIGAADAPAEKLDVRGNIVSSGTIRLEGLSSGVSQSSLLVADADGNVMSRDVNTLIGGSNANLDKILVTDQSNNFFYRDASTFNLSPWDDPSASLITFDNGGIRISRDNDPGWSSPLATLDVVGDVIIRDVPRDVERTLHDVLVLGADGLIQTRNIFTFEELSPWTRSQSGIFLETGRIGIGEENTFSDVKAHILSSLKVGLNVTTNYGGGGYGILSTIDHPQMKAFAAIDATSGEDVFRVYGNGKVEAKEILVDLDIWHDDVFREKYKLKTLEEVEEFIKENQHLPEVPSEKEVIENGVNLGEMEGILLKKIEELTLYIIEQNKQLQEQNERIEALETKIEKDENE